MERQPKEARGRFVDLTSQMRYRLSIDGWCNESAGEPGSGYLARISISEQELPEIVDAFEEVLDGSGFTESGSTADLIGHFLVTESEAGQVDVASYASESQVQREYERVRAAS